MNYFYSQKKMVLKLILHIIKYLKTVHFWEGLDSNAIAFRKKRQKNFRGINGSKVIHEFI